MLNKLGDVITFVNQDNLGIHESWSWDDSILILHCGHQFNTCTRNSNGLIPQDELYFYTRLPRAKGFLVAMQNISMFQQETEGRASVLILNGQVALGLHHAHDVILQLAENTVPS